jgi:hypothetical protein
VALAPVLTSKSGRGCYGAPSILSNDFLEELFAETEIQRARKRAGGKNTEGVPALNASIRLEGGKGVVRGLPLFTRVPRSEILGCSVSQQPSLQ